MRSAVLSAVGGIQEPVIDGTGILLPDPADLTAFGSQVRQLLDNPDDAERIGKGASQGRIREHFVGDRHLLQSAQLHQRDHWRLVTARDRAHQPSHPLPLRLRDPRSASTRPPSTISHGELPGIAHRQYAGGKLGAAYV